MKATSEQLAQISLFAAVHPLDLERLQVYTQVHFYHREEIVLHEGDRLPPKLHAVLSGKILVKKLAMSGKETILRQLSDGEMFAAPALFGDGVAPATVVALQDSQIVLIDKQALLDTIQSTPEIALQILSVFTQRLQEMHQTIHGLVSERAIIRLVRLILYTADRYGVEQTKGGVCLNTKLPYQQMARMIGITYEECARLVKKDLHTIIDYGRGGIITIQDVSAMEALASETAYLS